MIEKKNAFTTLPIMCKLLFTNKKPCQQDEHFLAFSCLGCRCSNFSDSEAFSSIRRMLLQFEIELAKVFES